MKINLLIALMVLSVSEFSGADEISGQKSIFDGKTSIQDPMRLRDPFRRTQGVAVEEEIQVKGKQDSESDLQEKLKTIDIETLKLTGLIYGKDRVALARSGSKNFVLREGYKIGPDGAILKAIFPGGIVLVEKFKNIYNQDEFIEWIVPYKVNTTVSISRGSTMKSTVGRMNSAGAGTGVRPDEENSSTGGWTSGSSSSGSSGSTLSNSKSSGSSGTTKKKSFYSKQPQQ